MYINSIISGLTLGVAYWFDLSVTSSEPYPPTAKFNGSNITCNILELTGGIGATGPSGGSGTGANTFYGDQSIVSGNKVIVNTVEVYSGNTLTLNSPIVDIPTIFKISNYSSLNFADDSAAAAGGVPTGGIYYTTGVGGGMVKIRLT
jgi:hypothetical protein